MTETGFDIDRPRSPSMAAELLINAMTDTALLVLDAQGNIASWNRGAEEIFGWSAGDALGRSAAILYLRDGTDTRGFDRDLQSVRDNGRHETQGFRIRKDGSAFMARVTIAPIASPDLGEGGFAMITRDISEWISAEEAFRTREAHLRSILETVPDAMIVIDEEARIQSFSAAAERLFGYMPERSSARTSAPHAGALPRAA